MRTALRLACAALLALASFAADVTGKWSGEFGEGGGITVTFIFKQEGVKLTGTAEAAGGQPLEIKEGKVEGDKIFFIVNFDGGGGAMKITHEGTISADEIALNVKFEGGEGGGPMKLKRLK